MTETSCLHKKVCPQTISREETKALKELSDGTSRVILTADKGVAMVLL